MGFSSIIHVIDNTHAIARIFLLDIISPNPASCTTSITYEIIKLNRTEICCSWIELNFAHGSMHAVDKERKCSLGENFQEIT